ncbi:hypothetical protein ACFY9Q_17635 [Streptomyces sp. NPDC012389]|uniref:hypothetical protein n=1 Tax=unclassified Streptomyces TaxID=2593676 RepID=UPI00159EFCC9|nr:MULTISPECIES: hypothetical protein [unclassified Streptomyces]
MGIPCGFFAERAFKVPFDRPYSDGGHPLWFEMDISLTWWAEMTSDDVTYASGLDLARRQGHFDGGRAMVFPERSPAGAENHVVACREQDPGPTPDEHGPTVRGRDQVSPCGRAA